MSGIPGGESFKEMVERLKSEKVVSGGNKVLGPDANPTPGVKVRTLRSEIQKHSEHPLYVEPLRERQKRWDEGLRLAGRAGESQTEYIRDNGPRPTE